MRTQQFFFKALYSMLPAVLILSLLLQTACSRFDPAAVRLQERERFLEELSGQTTARLQADPRITLTECIAIAQARNLSLQSARVQEQIAGLDRKIAFSAFLPRIDADMVLQKYRRQPHAVMGSQTLPISDRRVRERSVTLVQPVFDPYSWYLYSMFQKGEDISRLAHLRTRQYIALEVIRLFFEGCMLADMQDALAAALSHARALQEEITQSRAVGLTRESELADVRSLVQQRRFELAENERELRLTRARLLEVLGLDPLAEIIPVHTADLQTPGDDLESLLLNALLDRPELLQADLRHAIAGDRIKQALTAFLPRLQASLGIYHTSDSFVKYNTQTVIGLAGVLSVLNGFADVQTYRRARAREQTAFIQREQAALMIMLQVQQAFLNLQSSREFVETARSICEARSSRLREQQARRSQGMLTPAGYLEALAAHDAAQARLRAALYMEQIARAVLADVTGAGIYAAANDSPALPADPPRISGK